jgi:hypothetical protein
LKNNSKFIEKKRFKSAIINIVFSFVIFLVFVVVIELVLRTTHLFGARLSWTESDPILGYRFVPNSKYWCYKECDRLITGEINNYGWRDKDWSLEKPQNTYRVAVLGDSFVEAFQVESEHTFLSLTERELNKNHRLKFEFMNFGRSGYTQTEELLVLSNYVVQFSPDMLVLFFQPSNDIRDVGKETATNLTRPFYHISGNEELIPDTSFAKMRKFKIIVIIDKLKTHSVLISLICQRYNHYQQDRVIAKLPKGVIDSYLSLCTANQDTRYLRNYQLNKMLIKAMAEYCKNKGIKFILVTINTNAYIPKVEEQYKALDPTFDANFFEDDLKKYAISINIEYIGLQTIFRQAYEKDGIPLHWEHWNYQGNKLVTNALVNKLKTVVLFEEW